MVELRSGTTTGGDNPRTPGTRDPNIPENIEVVNQEDQGEVVDQAGQLQITCSSTRGLCWRNLSSNSGKSSTRYTSI
jgi:hypothetical protein